MKKETLINPFEELYRSAIERHLVDNTPGAILSSGRDAAFARFKELGGVPDRTENYRYIDLVKPLDFPFHASFSHQMEQPIPDQKLFQCNVFDLDVFTIYVLNGRYYPWMKKMELPDGVILCGLSNAAEEYPELMAPYYNRFAPKDEALFHLNTALAIDGYFLYIPKGVRMERPLQVINLLGSVNSLMCFQRNLVVLEDGAEATILSCDHSDGDVRMASNTVTEIVLGERSVLDYYQVQNRHLNSTQIETTVVEQKHNSSFKSHVISLFGGEVRNNLYVSLSGNGAETKLNGLYLADCDQVVDNFTSITHNAPECRSSEHYKGVLDERALANFMGLINVKPNAQKTEAFQRNDNLLLTDTAHVNTRPQLIIDADDVKCSHGAAVGQIDEDALFYLRSRGIGESEARMMLMFGFAHEIVAGISLEALRNQIDRLVEKRLRGEFTKCNDCKLNCHQSAPTPEK